jgi:preprotein translocase subunit SecE
VIDTLNKQLAGAKPASGQLTGNRNDLWKWILLAVIIVAAIVANFFLVDQSVWYSTAIWIGALVVGAGLVLITAPGAQLVQFFKDSRIEIRKVVWPTRQETMQAALMVLVAVVLMSVLLWVIDMILFRIINFLTT